MQQTINPLNTIFIVKPIVALHYSSYFASQNFQDGLISVVVHVHFLARLFKRQFNTTMSSQEFALIIYVSDTIVYKK
jgi:hypothetical protein